ncbi:MAG: helix-turn-helix domain-containing protein [Bacteriovoracaceae bacterium]|nr:helix-turn-helix domain-containing protein [Bacteroidota bacterium]
MGKEILLLTTEEIADLLGVNPNSILRWADSGKLKCVFVEGGNKKFSIEHLAEFAITYNISMKFLDTLKLDKIVRNENEIRLRTATR